MSKKVDKSRKSSKANTGEQQAKKRWKHFVSKSKKAISQIKENNQQINKLKKRNEKLSPLASQGKYLGKYVIINHIDFNGTWAYYTNTTESDSILMEGDDNPNLDDLLRDSPCIFTAREVKEFINCACQHISQFKDVTPGLVKWARRRLYGSVMPAYLAVAKAKYDSKHLI